MFGNLGEMAGLMKKFTEIQKNLKQMKEDLAQIEIIGKDPGGKIEVRILGDLTVQQVRVNPSLFFSSDPVILEAACMDAFQDVLVKFKEISAKKLSDATGGLNIPGLN